MNFDGVWLGSLVKLRAWMFSDLEYGFVRMFDVRRKICREEWKI